MNSKLSLVVMLVSVYLICLQVCTGAPMAQTLAAPIADRSVKLVEIVAAQRARKGKTVLNLVVENDEARKAYFEEREKALHKSRNGANAGPVKGEDASDRAKRQNPHVLPHLQPSFNTASNAALTPNTEADEIAEAKDAYRKALDGSALAKALELSQAKPQAVVSSGSYSGRRKRQAVVGSHPAGNVALSSEEAAEIAAARESYRKALEGSALARALALSQAKPQVVDPSGSYAGR